MKFNQFFKKVFSAFFFSILIVTTVISANAQTYNIEDIQKKFFNVFKEGIEVNKTSVALDDFILNPDFKYTVKITFVDSVAGYDNKLGYFLYDADITTPEQLANFQITNIDEENIIFESVKSINAGESKDIGPFTKDKKVGFFIESPDGKFYSIQSLNENKNSHSAKYRDKVNNDYFVALGFEDMVLTDSDKDYNDVLFIIDVANYDFNDVPDIGEVKPSPCDKSESPGCIDNPTPSVETTPVPSDTTEITDSNDKTDAVPSSTPATIEADPKSPLPKTGEESPNTYIIIGISLLLIGIISLSTFKLKAIKITNK